MARIVLGPTIGMASGSVGATVYSHNRYGPYIRNRTKPTKSVTSYALLAKARLKQVTQAWQVRTAAQQQTWNTWAANNPVPDSLGQPTLLTGHAAYVGLNVRRLILGHSLLVAPPIVTAPYALLTCTVTPDKTAGSCEIGFTATPLGADDKLWILACYLPSNGVTWVMNRLRFIGLSAAAQASAYEAYAAIEARLGTMIIGQRVVVHVSVVNESGLLSAPLRAEGTVV